MSFLSIISNVIIILILTVIIFILRQGGYRINIIHDILSDCFRNLVNEIGNERFNSTEQIFETVRDSIKGLRKLKFIIFGSSK